MTAQTDQPARFLPRACSSRTLADRCFTGDANRAPAKDMETTPASSSHASMHSSAFSKAAAASQINMFPAGTASAAPLSPSKKRIHRDLKLKRAAAAPQKGVPSKANPFAQYGVPVEDAAIKSAASALSSPNKGQSGAPSPKKSPRRVARPSNGVQGMSIDTPEHSPASAQAPAQPPAGATAAAAATFPGSAPQQAPIPYAFSFQQGQHSS